MNEDDGGFLQEVEVGQREPEGLPVLVVIVDTSVLIELKSVTRVPADELWRLLRHMDDLVEEGRLAFPRRVHRELTALKYPDAPGTWCANAVHLLQFDDPDDTQLAAVVHATADLVDVNAEVKNEPADPYIVAMAYALMCGDPPCDVAVATNDLVDRLPLKISLKTACERLGIACWDPETFIGWVRESEQLARSQAT